MMWTVKQIRAVQEFALGNAWALPQELDPQRAMLFTPDGWAVALSVNR